MTLAEAMVVWDNVCDRDRRTQQRDRRFPVGTVVRRGDGPHGTATRGIVTAHGPSGLAAPSDMVVRVQAGVHHVSDDIDAWERVPIDEQTAEERVRAAALAYDPGLDTESLAWGLLGALLPPRRFDRMTDAYHDWPAETDLALELARMLDGRR